MRLCGPDWKQSTSWHLPRLAEQFHTGLGYYRRAKNLHKTAKILVKNYKSKIPNKFDEIKKLPGIGEYTANALLALIYNQPRIPFDGNTKRVFRIFRY